jgi:predicted GIY-YIG superfamily endonuclease
MRKEKQSQEGWFVYMVYCIDGTIYTGITNDIALRISKHNSGKGAKYTQSRGPVVLLASWAYESKSAASKVEYKYKRLTRKAKEKLIAGEGDNASPPPF